MDDKRLYYDEDADLAILEGKTIAVVGYGNQGRSQALNMRDTARAKKLNTTVIIGNIQDKYRQQAEKDGFEVGNIAEACDKASIIFVLLPDELSPIVYKNSIEPKLKKNEHCCRNSRHCRKNSRPLNQRYHISPLPYSL